MDQIAATYMGRGSKKIVHMEHWSNPDAETYLTGIDYYEHPRLCRQKLLELYPCLKNQMNLDIPESDDPKPRPAELLASANSGKKTHVRWGDSITGTWEHGEAFFKNTEEVYSFSPLDNCDHSGDGYIVEAYDYSNEEKLYAQMRSKLPLEWTVAPEGSGKFFHFYNTMFMWPLLSFGWELFLECCLDERFERIMGEFAEINRRVYRNIARLPVNFVISHDDICMAAGPVCSPEWMNKFIYPRYEEFWGILKSSGKEVIFISDGNVDKVIDNVMACGARGVISEPFTDYKSIARKHKDCFIAGEGDNRILQTCDKDLIKKMVLSMVETGNMSRGYMMCIGNHIPWNVNPEGIKMYLDYCAEFGYRDIN